MIYTWRSIIAPSEVSFVLGELLYSPSEVYFDHYISLNSWFFCTHLLTNQILIHWQPNHCNFRFTILSNMLCALKYTRRYQPSNQIQDNPMYHCFTCSILWSKAAAITHHKILLNLPNHHLLCRWENDRYIPLINRLREMMCSWGHMRFCWDENMIVWTRTGAVTMLSL